MRETVLVGTLGTMLFVLVGCGGGGGQPPTEPPPGEEIASVSVEVGAGVTIEDGTPTIEVGETADFDATARDADGDPVSTSFTWSSLDPVVATVDGDGTATGESPGTARIVARASNGVRDTATLAVVDSVGETATVTVTPGRDTVRVGRQVAFEAVAEDADGDTVETAFAWSSLNTGVATVDGDGTATGRSPGEAAIVAEAANGVSDTATLVVRDTAAGDPDDDPPTAEILEPADGATFREGESVTFRGEASDPDEGSLPDDDLVWESDRDGELGRGAEIQASLSAGSHVVSFTVTDSAGQSDADSIELEIEDAPDLVATALELLPRGVLTDQSPEAEAIVENSGFDAGPYRWSVSSGGTELASGDRGGLVEGGTDTIPVVGLGTFAAGGHELVFTVDVDDTVSEQDEANNTVTSRLQSRSSGFAMEIRFAGTVPAQLRDEVLAERDRWQRVITGDLGDVTVDSLKVDGPDRCFGEDVGLDPITETIDDLVVYVRTDSIDGPGMVLAQAGPCFLRLDDADDHYPPLPLIGSMTIDSADVSGLRGSGRIGDVILHEFGHTLGFSGFMWQFQGGAGDDVGPHQLVVGANTSDPRFVGPLAVREYRDAGGSGTSAPIESGGGDGTAGSHWRETVFDDELMTGFINFGDNPLSAVTIGSLADMFYAVDLGEADPYSVPSSSAIRAGGSGGMELRERILTPRFGVDVSGRLRRIGGRGLRPVDDGGDER